MDLQIKKGLYGILYERLEELQQDCGKEIIPFPLVFQKICSTFSIKKKECWEILFLVRDFGIIEIVPFRGIKITELSFLRESQ